MKRSSCIITAIGTPLDAAEGLHLEGLERHLHDQWSAGIDGILVAGSMGLMQMLHDKTYQELIKHAVGFSRNQGEVLVGIGDASFVRTRDRIEYAVQFPIDGVVVLAPYIFRVSQSMMIDYFCGLADISPVPVYLYDLPVRTGVKLDIATYEACAKHPNIKGAKISGRIDVAKELLNHLESNFRIIVAEPDQLDSLLKAGICNHLDGIYAVEPRYAVAIADAAAANNWPLASSHQTCLNALIRLLRDASSDMGAFTAFMNARGIPGNFHAAPYATLGEKERMSIVSAANLQPVLAPTL